MLNLGAGDWRPAGYMSVDMTGADFNHDLSVLPWPFADESADQILASHVLEHFDREGGRAFLAECHRILKPNAGGLHLAVPDLDKFIVAHVSGDFSALGGYHWTSLDDLMGGGAREPRPEWRHRYMYTFDSLAHALEGTGFRWVLRHEAEGLHNPAYRSISLYVDAHK